MTFSGWVNKWISQLAHVGWGAYLTIALSLQFTWHGIHPAWGPVAVIAFAAAKEGIFDPLTEDKTTQGSGWLDFGFWVLGVILGIVTCL